MNTISLNGVWKLYYFLQKGMHIEIPEQLSEMKLNSINTSVPGNVELDLMNEGVLPDLFFGDNIHSLKPYEFYEYWYQREFYTPDWTGNKRIKIVFHGADCLATYWLNGVEIGKSNNMLIAHEFDVTDHLVCSGNNVLTVRLKSPILEAMNREYSPYMHSLPINWEQLHIRKAPHCYGWDIMPRAVTAGLWRSVELVACDEDEISNLYFYTWSLDRNNAKLGVFFRVNVNVEFLEELKLYISGTCGDSTFEVSRKLDFVAGNLEIDIENAMLWWPKDYGKSNLYTVNTKLLHKDKVIAERLDTIGIRKVELIKTDVTGTEKPGEFLFKINGVPVFCKGANWVPVDVFHSRDVNRYDRILSLFEELNCNIIRCWGGNVYEDHAFYEFCDKHGIMVWQDFTMACQCCPHDDAFLESISKEVEFIVRKLRNHSSIIIWSGDNECDEAYSYKTSVLHTTLLQETYCRK